MGNAPGIPFPHAVDDQITRHEQTSCQAEHTQSNQQSKGDLTRRQAKTLRDETDQAYVVTRKMKYKQCSAKRNRSRHKV